MESIEKVLSSLTLEEKAALAAGTNFMYTRPIKRLGIPSIRMSDGPHGLRVQDGSGDNGVAGSKVATAFPSAATTACSWNEENLFKMGEAMADEASFYGIDLILGPGCNIKRNPLAGRNFEYFSEDPLLAGKLAGAEIKGMQGKGISACLKHFALNNAENYRFMGDSVVDERAMREIYLNCFKIAIKEGNPDSLMCAYNKINGVYCCQNKWLLNDVLRDEWGFDGLVMTDWGATHDRVKMLESGLDLEMPGDTDICRKWIIDGVNNNSLNEKDLDKAVRNVLKLVAKHSKKEKEEADFKKHNELALSLALDSAVLLKNDGVLPLSKNKKYLVIGELFEKMRYQGAGSSMINPCELISPKNAFDNAKVSYEYCKGYKENQLDSDPLLMNESLEKAKEYDEILLFAGLTDYVETEGMDRESLSLPNNQLELINSLISLKKMVVVVLFGGSVISLPFKDGVNGILDMYLPGQAGGEATRKLLFGESNPSGKLAESWPLDYKEVPYGDSFSKNETEVYKESIFVGYRYYDMKEGSLAYPFGYGLSYTTFEYSDMEIVEKGEEITVSFTLKNVGKYFGGETAQLYVSSPRSNVYKPKKELRGFKKIYLEPNESKRETISLNRNDLAYWNIKEKRFVLESGGYSFLVASDSQNIKLSKTIDIQGENIPSPYENDVFEMYDKNPERISDEIFIKMSGKRIPPLQSKKPITLEGRFTNLKGTFLGKILFSAVLSVANKDMKKAKKMPEGAEKDNKIKGSLFLRRILESNSLITMSMSAGKNFPYNFALGFKDLANGRVFKGIKDFCSPIKVAGLPNEGKED